MAMMTRKEAHKILSDGLANAPSEHEWCMAFKMAMEDLDQESILDKIRVEILQVANQEKIHDEKWALGLRYAVKIIDKYKGEIEQVGNPDRLEGE